MVAHYSSRKVHAKAQTQVRDWKTETQQTQVRSQQHPAKILSYHRALWRRAGGEEEEDKILMEIMNAGAEVQLMPERMTAQDAELPEIPDLPYDLDSLDYTNQDRQLKKAPGSSSRQARKNNNRRACTTLNT